MCGINGIFGLKDEFRTRDLLVHMNHKLEHRGPDAQGIVTRSGIGLGHRRLSIIDLTENGRQPMANISANILISFNGEIYNFKQLKKEVRDYEWRTETDTEVIIALYEKYGESCFEKLDGMFAIAIWDDRNKKLVLARDRMGKKPLYYAWNEGIMVFSSEIRALLASQIIKPRISKQGLQNYLQFQTVYSPDTILEGVSMLPAGTYATVKAGIMDSKKFWSLDKAKETHTLTGPYDKVVKQTRELFFNAVEKRLISDVPLGAFLSGGVDSSCVVAAMAQLNQSSVKTFHVYFENEDFSERKYAELVAKKFRTEHHEIELTAADFLNEIPNALAAIDHPGVDGPNSYIVSKYTKEAGITVALSGMGGDELFGGYPVFKYLKTLNKYRIVGKTPVIMRQTFAKIMKKRLPEAQHKRLLQFAALKQWDLTHLYPIFRTVFTNEELKQFGIQPMGYKGLELDSSNPQKILTEVSIAECRTYLENVLLRDTDQMSMASSLEVRVPFLDKDLVEFILSLPDDFKPLKPQKKLIIDAMGDLLPEETWNRKKMGFTFPWKHWINHELKQFCEEQLEYMRQTNLVNRNYIDQLVGSLEQEVNETWYRVWNLVVLAHWMRKNGVEID
jgi:asparagine synthase (glutamine-hydrolysing)